MKIVRERPCQRRHHRVTAPMMVTLPGVESVKAENWSIGGCKVPVTNTKDYKLGQEMTLVYELPFQGFDISFEVNAKIVRIEENNGALAFEHQKLSERANDLMSHFIDDLIRGKMASVEDTICRIDIPVTPISTEPDANPQEDVPVRRWPIRAIVMSGFYGLLGISVFGYLSILFYSGFMQMEVRSAVVSQPLMKISMPSDGVLVPVKLQPGMKVEKGEAIARIESDELELKIRNKEAAYEKLRREARMAQEKFRIESERMRLYQVINQTDRQIAEARVNASKEALMAADAAYERMAKLQEKGLVEDSKFEEAAKRRAEAQARLEEHEYQHERTVVMDDVSDRRYFNHKEFVADLDMLALEIEKSNNELLAVQEQIRVLLEAKNQLVIKAPFRARVVAAKVDTNSHVSKNTEIATLAKDEAPTVTAYLSQEEILSVGLDDAATVYLPSLAMEIPAQVKFIDRNSSLLDNGAANYIWEERRTRSAIVSLEINPSYLSPEVTGGLPAVVLFSKRSSNNIYHRIGNGLKAIKGKFIDDTRI